MPIPRAPYHAQALDFVKQRTTEFTRHDLESAINVDIYQAGAALKRLLKEGWIKKIGGGAKVTYRSVPGGPKQNDPASKPQKKKEPAQQQELPALTGTLAAPLSHTAENAIQTFTSALIEAENLRNDNERMKHALTQILTIASNALLK